MKRLFAGFAAGLCMLPLISAHVSAETEKMTFELNSEERYVSVRDLKYGATMIHAQFYIRNYTEATAIRTALQADSPLEIVNGQLTQPFFFDDCFFRAYTQQGVEKDDKNIIVWNGASDLELGVVPMKVAVPGGSFAEFDVLIPQDTKPGVYQLGFKTGVKKNANGGKITETYAQNELEDLDIALKECSVIIEPESLRGDVNCDGQVDIHDAKYALDYDVQFNRARLQKTDEDLTSTLHTPYIHTAMEAANVDHESELNSKDALAILKYSTLKMAGLQQDWKTIFPDE